MSLTEIHLINLINRITLNQDILATSQILETYFWHIVGKDTDHANCERRKT